MKHVLPKILLMLMLLYNCAGEDSGVEKRNKYKGMPLEKSGKDAVLKIVSQEVYSLVLDSCISRSELILQDRVRLSPKMYQLINYGAHQYTCEFVNNVLGEVESGQLVESFYSKGKLLKVFRYKLDVSNYEEPIEFRMIFTDLHKLTEYRFFEWTEEYKEDLIEMNWF